MTEKKKIPFKGQYLELIAVFTILVIAPMVWARFRSSAEAEIARQQAEAEAVAELVADVDVASPSQTGAQMVSDAILTRATYLLRTGRDSGVGVERFINAQYQSVNDQLWDISTQEGVFDGDAEVFAKVSNLGAERQALELVKFWLANPDAVHTANGMVIDAWPNDDDSFIEEGSYANISP